MSPSPPERCVGTGWRCWGSWGAPKPPSVVPGPGRALRDLPAGVSVPPPSAAGRVGAEDPPALSPG